MMKIINQITFIFLLLLTITFYGCEEANIKKERTEFVVREDSNPLIIVEVDSCEYFLGEWGSATVLTHKGNCKFCVERNKNK